MYRNKMVNKGFFLQVHSDYMGYHAVYTFKIVFIRSVELISKLDIAGMQIFRHGGTYF